MFQEISQIYQYLVEKANEAEQRGYEETQIVKSETSPKTIQKSNSKTSRPANEKTK